MYEKRNVVKVKGVKVLRNPSATSCLLDFIRDVVLGIKR